MQDEVLLLQVAWPERLVLGAVRRGEHLGDQSMTLAQGRDLTLDGRTPRHQRGSANSTARRGMSCLMPSG